MNTDFLILFLAIVLSITIIVGLAIYFLRNKFELFFQGQIQTQIQSQLNQHLEFFEEKRRIEKQQEKEFVSKEFELLGHKVFEDSSQKLNAQSLQNLKLLLDPFKDRLQEFEKKVNDAYLSDKTERSTLRGELNKLMDLNQKISVDAQSLTRALKGDVKTQGTWGEMILENILERSGLRKDSEYFTQANFKDESGANVRPDIIVKLPDNKHIIVDSKMSLLSYEEYSRAQTAVEKEKWGKDFITSFKRHVDGLSGKKYHTVQEIGSPDFVLLFIPLEPAFALAFELKPDLFTESWEKNIAIVSPTTLLTTLRTVAALWKQDRQEKNALEIADRGGKLYDKFALLVQDFNQLGEQIDKLSKTHQGINNKLNEGNGNLISQVEKLRELGAKAEKRLSLS